MCGGDLDLRADVPAIESSGIADLLRFDQTSQLAGADFIFHCFEFRHSSDRVLLLYEIAPRPGE